MARSSTSKARLDQLRDSTSPNQEGPYTESPDETSYQADQSPASESPADNSNDDPWLPDDAYACPSSKLMGRLRHPRKGGFGSPWFDVKRLVADGTSGGFGWSVF